MPHLLLFLVTACCQCSHTLEKYLNIWRDLLKIKFAWIGAGKLLLNLEKYDILLNPFKEDQDQFKIVLQTYLGFLLD